MLISSRANPKIKHLRALQQRKARLEHKEFVVEGAQLVSEALRAGFEIQQLFRLEQASLPAGLKTEHYQLTPELMEYASSLQSAPEEIGIFKLRQPEEDSARHPAWLVADRLQDPGNAGALLRLADACSWRGILTLGGFPDVFSPKVLRASMGSSLRIPVRALDLKTLSDWQQEGWQLIGTAADAEQSSLNCRLPVKILLAVGHEGQGMDPALLKLCNSTLAIPIDVRVDSLNVATATAMLMHEYLRQHHKGAR